MFNIKDFSIKFMINKLWWKKDKANFLTILEKNRGLVSYAIKESGIAIQTYYNWLEKDPDFRSKIEQIHEGIIDWVESKLYEKIDEKDIQGIMFSLKSKGKKRGYGDSLIIDGNVSINVKIEGLDEIKPEKTDGEEFND